MSMDDGSLSFDFIHPDTGSRVYVYLNPRQAEIWHRLRKENPERYKDDPKFSIIFEDIREEEKKQ